MSCDKICDSNNSDKKGVTSNNDKMGKAKLKLPINQIVAAIVCNLGSLTTGMTIGWLSPALPQMRMEGGILAVLDPDLSITLASWMAGIFPLAAFFFSPIAPGLSETIGRKACSIVATIPFAINSIIILTSDNIYYLLAGRLIAGIGSAVSISNVPSYIGETSEIRIRGSMGSVLTLAYTVGITIAYVVGGFINYKAGAMALLISTFLNALLFVFVPETPAWLVRNGKYERAAQAIAWLWRVETHDPSVQGELKRLQDAAKIKFPTRFEAAKLLLLSKPLRRGFMICIMTMAIQGWMGMIAVHSYSVTIFMESGAGNLSAEGAATVYGCIQIAGSCSVLSLVERAGRKILFATSSFFVAFFMFCVATYFILQQQGTDLTSVQWIPVVSLSLCVYSYTVGAGSIPFILVSDVITNEVRSVAAMVIVQIMFFNSFVSLRFFAPAIAAFGNHVVFYFFGTAATLAGLLGIFVLPETKGKSFEEIQDILGR